MLSPLIVISPILTWAEAGRKTDSAAGPGLLGFPTWEGVSEEGRELQG